MAVREMTCIVCPQGCKIKVEYEGSEIRQISGFTCKRGEKYASKEIVSPERTITSTVAACSNDGELTLVPVKSDKPIPKNKMFDAMELINKQKISLPVEAGQVIVSDFMEKGINLVACKKII
ncbi:MAG: DUF1667 domain-containing protein [Clostridia bacterium]|nr:DUF1667 domain-containing protein [Clostridia bacterium]